VHAKAARIAAAAVPPIGSGPDVIR